MKPSEISSRITPMAEPYPRRLASPMMLLVTSTESSSSPFVPLLIT